MGKTIIFRNLRSGTPAYRKIYLVRFLPLELVAFGESTCPDPNSCRNSRRRSFAAFRRFQRKYFDVFFRAPSISRFVEPHSRLLAVISQPFFESYEGDRLAVGEKERKPENSCSFSCSQSVVHTPST